MRGEGLVSSEVVAQVEGGQGKRHKDVKFYVQMLIFCGANGGWWKYEKSL